MPPEGEPFEARITRQEFHIPPAPDNVPPVDGLFECVVCGTFRLVLGTAVHQRLGIITAVRCAGCRPPSAA